MPNLLTDLTMREVTVSPAVAEDNGGPLKEIFLDAKNLTFPVAVLLIRIAWDVSQAVWDDLSGRGFPIVASLILCGSIALANFGEKKVGPLGWPLGLVVAFLNAAVIAGAVLGVPSAWGALTSSDYPGN